MDVDEDAVIVGDSNDEEIIAEISNNSGISDNEEEYIDDNSDHFPDP